MTAEQFLSELRSVLDLERGAIRRLDAATITSAAEKKEALMTLLKNSPDAEKAGLLTALAQAREELKRNLVLLAHARDFVRDAVTRARPAALLPGARLAIKL